MTLRRIVVVGALALLAFAAGASAAPPPLTVELPLGPVVRRGRPLSVRVPGAAAVRAGNGPWAFAAGASGDEFLVVVPAPTPNLELRIRRREDEEPRDSSRLAVRVLPADGLVRAVFGRAGGAGGTEVVVDPATLPTLPEAWLLFDELPPPPSGASEAAIDALSRARGLPRPGDPLRAPFQPWTYGPDAAAHRALAAAARAGPSLPRGVAAALCVLAGAELILLLVVRRRRPWPRAAWLSAPPLVALAWLALGGRVSSTPLRGAAVLLEGPEDVLVVLRVAGPQSGGPATGSFEVPADAATPTVVPWDADDRGPDVTVLGRTVEVTLAPGRSCVVAWRAPPAGETPAGAEGEDGEALPSDVRGWVASRGLDLLGPAGGPGADPPLSARGIRFRPALALRVGARK